LLHNPELGKHLCIFQCLFLHDLPRDAHLVALAFLLLLLLLLLLGRFLLLSRTNVAHQHGLHFREFGFSLSPGISIGSLEGPGMEFFEPTTEAPGLGVGAPKLVAGDVGRKEGLFALPLGGGGGELFASLVPIAPGEIALAVLGSLLGTSHTLCLPLVLVVRGWLGAAQQVGETEHKEVS